ncbi:DNA ligase D [Nitratireductor basaltis]|uniref:DNA ligase (ATP) n=1 Tax=Nitratireductor basaltis TaxID=472175 RepID=A0A084UA00_9HYPH|nr:DNA ligase D [Nitratireductor basaltis]KFB09786.1 DNA ligase D [Nitratireductor basaltis]
MARNDPDTLLKDYNAKRDFTRTREPQHAEKGSDGEELSFVIQKHDATRLHYDFRLEWEGVLKSWAVTKGPSLDPSEKRLAVRTEDHPLSYGGFEGTIPEKEYGGGTVMLWDRGVWEPESDPAKGLTDGKLTFRLKGQRLTGTFSLVRMRSRKGEKRENWLLIKADDETASRRGDVLKKHTKSVASGRTMAAIAKSGSEWREEEKQEEQASGKPELSGKSRPIPRWREPQLATLEQDPPEGDEWLAEMKYDGYRALIAIGKGGAKVFTRNGKDWTDKFRHIAEAAARLPTSGTLLDGEIVAYSSGRTDFSSLQAAIKAGGDMSCFVFDLLQIDGADVTDRPLTERKERLAALMKHAKPPLALSTDIRGHAATVLEKLCAGGHEGIIAKRADAPYRSGRNRSWLKVKCSRRQELVIGGFSASDKKGRPFASLLLGAYEGDRLVYRGRVGTGFNEDVMEDLAGLFARRKRKTSPFHGMPKAAAKGAHFITPDLVAEIEFAEFTADGMVRHGAFKGLRQDKDAKAVSIETATEGEGAAMEHEGRTEIAGIKLSSADKVLFPAQGVTKADLAAHYERVADRMLPLIGNRLLSLVRCPDGRTGQCFFQKHGGKGFPEAFKRMMIEEKDGEKAEYLYADDLSALVAGVQMGSLEFHIWGSKTDRLEKPDRLVFDLDPDEGLDFSNIRDAAFDVRDRLKALGLKTVAMVTGGKGIHVIAPLERRAEWPEVKEFARGFAKWLSAQDRERYLAEASKARRKGRIFIDWLRNERGATAIAPYSARSREGCPIATPVSWKELEGLERANGFGIADMAERLKQPDPWAGISSWRQSITAAMRKAVAED